MEFFTHLAEPWVQLAVIVLGLWAGVAGAYGRELHSQRKPSLDWWISRILILPILGIAASAAVEQFKLSRQQSALLAAMLALSGYEALRLLQSSWLARFGGGKVEKEDEPIAPAPREPAPYASVIDTDDKGRATAHMMPVDHEKPTSGGVGEGLRGVYQAMTKEVLPGDLADLLGKMDGSDHGNGNDGADSAVQPGE